MSARSGKSGFTDRKSSFNRIVLRWYSRSARQFPWRDIRNSYRILVSEVMLQQTQVSRVAEKYPRFIRRFPSFSSLAKARSSTVIRAWKGMGYNNRAVRLHRLARIVETELGGTLPRTTAELESLPGIGKYTAHAIACFAFRQHVPVVDTNIRRVLSRTFPVQARRADIWVLSGLCLPRRNAYDWNQALMDLGSTICTAGSPRCGSCPVSGICPSAFRVRTVRTDGSKTEPFRDGLPDRIYRGRIVEYLRQHPRGSHAPVQKLGPRIKQPFSPRDTAWLMRLLGNLERDGLIQVKRSQRGTFVSLPQ